MKTAWVVLHRLRLVIPLVILVTGAAAISAAPPTFSTKRLINTFVNGLLPFDVRTEDIDLDGDTDLYTANYSGRISWFENDGAHPPGPWDEHIITEFADGNEAVIAIPVDADADIDFLYSAFNRDEVAWYSNGGDNQTWAWTSITFNATLAVAVWAADLDRDGDNDAITVLGSDSTIVWYENMGGSPTVWTARTLPSGGSESVQAADIDQDGDLDLVSG